MRPHKRPTVGKGIGLLRWSLASLSLLVSLELLRLQAVIDLDLGVLEAASLGVLVGWIYDIALVLLLLAVGLASSVLSPTIAKILWISTAFTVWFAGLANLLYFRFFGSILELWVIRFHVGDTGSVATGAWALSLTPAILASGICLLSGVLVAATRPRQSDQVTTPRTKLLITTAMVLLIAVAVREIPGWSQLYDTPGRQLILKEQILQVWLRDLAKSKYKIETEWSWYREVWTAHEEQPTAGTAVDGVSSALASLSRYHVYPGAPQTTLDGNPAERPTQEKSPSFNFDPDENTSHSDLYRAFRPSSKHTRLLRRQMGLPQTGRVNVLVIFVESMRSLEFLHPELQDKVYPGLRRIVETKGISFTQGYASALTAGESVRGRFSTLCSFLPNMNGVATYLGYPFVKATCLADLFKSDGNRTVWLTTAPRWYHNASVFELGHGTQDFYDEVYFLQKGITDSVGDWGLADLPFLEETVHLLEDVRREGNFFAALTTISSHFPMSVVEEGPIPEALARETEGHPDYQGYLSRMIYEDLALTRFFELFFESYLAEETVVVIVGDHSIAIRPHLDLTAVQMKEMEFRVPIAIVTKNMETPQVVHHPVHQVDVAPTIARIAGISGDVSWMGRGLFSRPASPWVYTEQSGTHYRVEDRSCYSLVGKNRPVCWKLANNQDPLLDTELAEIEENPRETEFFEALASALELVISSDSLIPGINTTQSANRLSDQ